MHSRMAAVTDPLLLDIPAPIETARLVVRPHRAGDGPVLHAALAESIVELRRFLWNLPWVAEDPTPGSAEARCRTCESNFIARTELAFLVFEKASGVLVASVGLHRIDWRVPKMEVGYWVRTSAAGNGHATEAVRAVVSCAFEHLGAERIELVTDEENVASRRVAERCGFALEGILRHAQRGRDGGLRNNCLYAKLPPRAGSPPT